MDALLTNGSGQLPPGSEPEKRSPTAAGRTARAATVFAAIYLALALGSPLIVRYAPSDDGSAMAAFATRIEQPRCATAPEFGQPCASRPAAVRDASLAKRPDL